MMPCPLPDGGDVAQSWFPDRLFSFLLSTSEKFSGVLPAGAVRSRLQFQGFVDVAVFFSPVVHNVDDGQQAFTQFCQMVFAVGWQFRINSLGYDQVFFQLAEVLVQYTVDGFRYFPMKLAGTFRPLAQGIDDARFPF